MAEHVDDALRAADAAIAATKATKPADAAQARVRCAELMNLQQTQLEASRKVVAANAQKRIASSNGHALAADPFSKEVLHALAEGLISWLGPLLADIDKRIAGLEATQLTDGGVWKPEKEFRPNQLATYRGAIWICLKANSNERPGTGKGAWRLMHKTEDGGR